VNLIVKIHPNEDEGLVRRQAREWEWPDSVFTKTFDIHQLFAAADAAIMVTSMAGIEAMALDCPSSRCRPRERTSRAEGCRPM
jgi:hypothetical protein